MKLFRRKKKMLSLGKVQSALRLKKASTGLKKKNCKKLLKAKY